MSNEQLTISNLLFTIHNSPPDDWTAAELGRVETAVHALLAGLGGDEALLGALLGRVVTLRRHHSEGLMGWSPRQYAIYCFDDLWGYSQATLNWVLAHEVGHVAEQTFASAEEFRQLTGGRWHGEQYLLGDLPPEAARHGGKWSSNADRHPCEDWADTFACLTVGQAWVGELIGNRRGPGRLWHGRGVSPLRAVYYEQVLVRAREAMAG